MTSYTAVKSNGRDLNIKQDPWRESPTGSLLWLVTVLSSSCLGRMMSWSPQAEEKDSPSEGVPRTTVSLTGARLHHSVPIKSSFLDECLCQAGPDASETCNYSWLPTPTCSAPVPVLGTSWPCLASCLFRDGGGGTSLEIQAHATHFLQNTKTKQKI